MTGGVSRHGPDGPARHDRDQADSYGEVAAGLDLAARRACAPAFDKRPGTLEATRGLPPLLVAARRGLHGWRVWISATGQGPHALTPAAARKLAGELIEYAHICECDPGTVPARCDPSTTSPLGPPPRAGEVSG